MAKLKKVSITIGICAMVLISIFETSANAMVQPRANICCGNMSTYSYIENRGPYEYRKCYNTNHPGDCLITSCKEYRVKKCKNCGAIHSEVYIGPKEYHS